MSDLLFDPEMKEVVIEFVKESKSLLSDMEDMLDEYEEDPTRSELLEKFGQTVDRIMGTAQTLGANEIGTICQMGKILGYKSSQSKDIKLNKITAGILLGAVDLLNDIFESIESGEKYDRTNFSAFIGRLNWLSEKYRHIDRASCSIDSEKKGGRPTETTSELDELIKRLG